MGVFVIGTDLLREESEADWPDPHTHTHTHTNRYMPLSDKAIQAGSPSVCWEGSSRALMEAGNVDQTPIPPTPSSSFHQCPLCLFTRLQSTVL